jgi:hypothetical protein
MRLRAPETRASFGRALIGLDVGDGRLAVLPVDFRVEGNLLAFTQGVDPCAFQRRDVNEHVLAAVFRLDEAVAFGRIEELYDTCLHDFTLAFAKKSQRRPLMALRLRSSIMGMH